MRWKDGVWEQQLLYGLPITLALVGLIALLVDGLALIPYQFPNSYYLWVGLVVLALVVGVIGWRRFRNWRRVVSVLSVLLVGRHGLDPDQQAVPVLPDGRLAASGSMPRTR